MSRRQFLFRDDLVDFSFFIDTGILVDERQLAFDLLPEARDALPQSKSNPQLSC